MAFPSKRKQIEDAVVSALTPLKTRSAGGLPTGYLRAVKPYNSELEGEDLDEVRRALSGNLPGALVFTERGDWQTLNVGRTRFTKDLQVTVLIVSGNLRGPDAQARGFAADQADPGLYAISEDIVDKLGGLELGVAGVGRLVPMLEEIIVQEPDLSVWRLRLSSRIDQARPEAAAADLTGIAGRHVLPTAEKVLAAGTGDALAVLGGLVTLTDAGAAFVGAHVGHVIRVEGATTPENNGSFLIVAAPTPDTIQYRNALAVAEAFAGTWKIVPRLVETLASFP